MTLRSEPLRAGLSSSTAPSLSPSSQPILLEGRLQERMKTLSDAFPGQGEKWVPASTRDYLPSLALAAWAEEAGPPPG